MSSVKAIVCDVYRTILEVGDPPAEAESRWRKLFGGTCHKPPPLALLELAERCREIVSEDHRQSRSRGIAHPEVDWPAVMTRALPDLDVLPRRHLDEFLFQHAQLLRTIRIMPGCAEFLRRCLERGILLGIASNAQAYTLRELDSALKERALDRSIFQSDLTVWSFEHGFSKPDPHLFEILRARLQNRSIVASETLMIGDRLDNDVAPARKTGWRTWLFSADGEGPDRGDWRSVRRVLFEAAGNSAVLP
jgi:FMN phosphatase YigB (HAD superfamily)